MSLTKLNVFAYDAFFINILYSLLVIYIMYEVLLFDNSKKEQGKLFKKFHNSFCVNSEKKCMVIFLEQFQFIVTKPNSFAF